jgi:hypothetical protein
MEPYLFTGQQYKESVLKLHFTLFKPFWDRLFTDRHYLGYALLSLISGPIISLYLMLRRNYKNIYALCLISICCYYLFTPILNRTHLLWFLPFMLIGPYEMTKGRIGAYLAIVLTIYLSLYLYLLPWSGGNIKAPGKVIIQTVADTYYDYRRRVFEQ